MKVRDGRGRNAGRRYEMRRGRKVITRSGKWRRRNVRRFMKFNKGDMKGIKDAVRGLVPKAVSLRLRSISNENAWN